RIAAKADVPPDGFAAGEVLLREALVDDYVAVAVVEAVGARVDVGELRSLIAIVELASRQHRDAHRPEVPGADGVAVRIHWLALRGVVPLDRHGAIPLAAVEQSHVRERHALHARLRAEAVDERSIERRHADGRVARETGLDIERDDALGVQPEIDEPQVAKRADEEPGADEQQDR